MYKIDLIVIDPQNDFCVPPMYYSLRNNTGEQELKGALYVNDAENDMIRVANMIKRIGHKLNDIHITLDTHHMMDIAHPYFWKDSNGNHPNPFTIIKYENLKNGEYTTSIPSLYKRAESYVQSLEKNNRYPLCIWPPHCIIGSWGHNVFEPLYKSLIQWEIENKCMVDYVTKGSNPYTEHYSAIQADVPDPNDVTTQVNTGFVKNLMTCDKIVFAGEASSHCLANSVRDIANQFHDESFIKKIVLLTDGTSPVKGFEFLEDQFIKDMKNKGMELSTTDEFLK